MTKGRIFLCTCSISKQYHSVFGSVKIGFHYDKKHSFRTDKDGGYEHVPSSNLFCGLYQYISNRKNKMTAKQRNVILLLCLQ